MTDTQFSTRSVPWMIHDAVEIDQPVTTDEAIHLAGLDWEVKVVQDGYKSPVTGNWKVDKSKRKLVRLDTDAPLGTVSPTYEHLPYREAFEFMDEIHPEIVAAGGLKDGKQAFVVVKAPNFETIQALDGDDPHQLYVVLRASHDGSRALEVNVLPLRDACTNMMPLPSFGKDAQQRWSIRHTKNMREKMAQAQKVLVNLDGYTEEYKKLAVRLANIELQHDEARKVILELVPSYIKRPDRQADAIMDVYDSSTRNHYNGTAWGVLNAVTEYHDHYRGGDDRQPETRWIQGLDGSTSAAVKRTVELLTR